MVYDNGMIRLSLTFDDGPNTKATLDILDILDEYKIPASFFLVGKNISEQTAPVIEREVRQGCSVECHSFSHKAFPSLSAEQMRQEIQSTNALIEQYTKTKPLFFRPPYIALNDLMFRTINMPFIAGFGVQDWLEEISVEERVQKIMQNARDGQIILLHDQSENQKTVETVRQIVPALKKRGAVFYNIRQLFAECGIDPMSGHDKNKIWTDLL